MMSIQSKLIAIVALKVSVKKCKLHPQCFTNLTIKSYCLPHLQLTPVEGIQLTQQKQRETEI